MFKEEQTINGVLHWRNDPDGEFVAYTPEQLTKKLDDKSCEVEDLRNVLRQISNSAYGAYGGTHVR